MSLISIDSYIYKYGKQYKIIEKLVSLVKKKVGAKESEYVKSYLVGSLVGDHYIDFYYLLPETHIPEELSSQYNKTLCLHKEPIFLKKGEMPFYNKYRNTVLLTIGKKIIHGD